MSASGIVDPWPPGLPRHLTLPQTNLWFNVEVSAARYPDKPFIVFYDTPLTYAQFKDQCERVAGWLQHDCGVKAGDRVLLYMQNSPQWMVAFYAILRADAVVVPVNPMNRREEMRHYASDSGAAVVLVAQDLFDEVEPLLHGAEGLRHAIVATYSDALVTPTDLALPAFVAEPRRAVESAGVAPWHAVLEAHRTPGPLTAGSDDLCVMPYTSGTTGHPKGCMHTHRAAMATLVGGIQWFGRTQDAVFLSAMPLFHVTGMVGGMNGPLFTGGTVVVLARWDREVAAESIRRHRITVWSAISTMMIDFLSNPRLPELDLSSLQVIRGGGAAMPAAIVAALRDATGLPYVEGYGMSETLAATHLNPPQRAKPQCLGIPMFDVDSRVVDPVTLDEMAQGETGEIVVAAPQVMLGYWRDEAATRDACFERDGKRFLRTGDLAYIDGDGYFFMVDRLKRMINASGYKVWPAEVEALMYGHPAILEACVIAAPDARRGETVKALVVLREGYAGQVTEQAVIDWSREHMAAYKCPRIVEFVASLPKSASGKVMWRELQDRERGLDSKI